MPYEFCDAETLLRAAFGLIDFRFIFAYAF
jgi:hypothetical protein